MGTIADKLTYTAQAREEIRAAIVQKGVDCPSASPFCQFDDYIAQIDGGGSSIHKVRAPEIRHLILNKYNDTGSSTGTGAATDGSNAWVYRSILQHDLSVVPTDAEIISARLVLYAYSGNDNHTLSRCFVSRVTSAWEDNTAWSAQPTHQEYVNHKETPNIDVASGVPLLCEVDITHIVKQWIEYKQPNYGVVIRAISEGSYRYNWSFYTRLYNNGEYATYIDIIY